MKKNLLSTVIVLCLIAVGAEINTMFENGLNEIEEVLFSFALITFLIILVMYLFNSIYLNAYMKRNWLGESKNLTDF